MHVCGHAFVLASPSLCKRPAPPFGAARECKRSDSGGHAAAAVFDAFDITRKIRFERGFPAPISMG